MLQAKIDTNSAIFNIDVTLTKKVEELLEGEIAAAVENIADQARSTVVVDFGFLKGSIAGSSNGLEGSVKVTANYAPFVEFGTGGTVDVPSGLEDYAIQFKGEGSRTIDLKARPFLFPAFRAEVSDLNERLPKLISKIQL
jgi:hypothetical protein